VYAFALSSSTGKLGDLITSVASPTEAVRVIRILSEVTAVLFTALIGSTFDRVLWTSASTKKGLSMSALLSLSTSTGILGLLELLKWKLFGRHYLSIFIRHLDPTRL
jgi:hypothetical protein